MPAGGGVNRNPEGWMLGRALVAFLALPGMVAFVIPLLLAAEDGVARDRLAAQWMGLPLLAAGSFLLLWCVRDFHVSGKGTLAPWSPPRHLVTTGLYRWTRNPMYVAVLTILAGWALWFASTTLLVYAIAIAIAFHLRVVFFEEPWLARTHAEAWPQYRASVPRWLRRPGRRAAVGS